MSEYPKIQDRYSRAIDEIYALRALLARNARIIEAHLEYRTFPKSRRKVGWEQVETMRAAARGEAEPADFSAFRELKSVDADGTLTNWQWEKQQGWEDA